MGKLLFRHHLDPALQRIETLEAQVSALMGDTFTQDILDLLRQLEAQVSQLLAENRTLADGGSDGKRRTARRD